MSTYSSKENIKNQHAKMVKKVLNKEKIRIAFIVVYTSTFAARSVYEELAKDPAFHVDIIITPDILRGKENMVTAFSETFQELYYMYPNVKSCFNQEDNSYRDIKDDYDIVWLSNPYSNMGYYLYSAEYLYNNDVLLLYTTYGTCVSNWFNTVIPTMSIYQYAWHIFAETTYHLEMLRTLVPERHDSFVYLGNCKMDALGKEQEKKNH